MIHADTTQTVVEYKDKGNYSLDYHLQGGFYAGDYCTLLTAGQVELKEDLKVLKSEEYTQVAFMDFVRLRVEPVFPEARWIYHTPNGGKRSKREGAKMKRAGVKPGVPDLTFPYLNHNGSSVLYLELKQVGQAQTDEQIEFQKFVEKQNQEYKIILTPLEGVLALEKYTGMCFTDHLKC